MTSKNDDIGARIPVYFQITDYVMRPERDNEFYIYSSLKNIKNKKLAIRITKDIWDIAQNLSPENREKTRKSLKDEVEICIIYGLDQSYFSLYLDKGAFDIGD